MLRILLVTRDIAVVPQFKKTLHSDENIQLVGVAVSEAEAVRLVRTLKPDLVAVTPSVGDLESAAVVKELMVEAPVPIVVVTYNFDPVSDRLAAEALASGALAIAPAPGLQRGKTEEASNRAFLSSLASMSQVKVVRHWRRRSLPQDDRTQDRQTPRIGVVGIAASTGGPAAVRSILEGLPPSFPAPVLVVQHISDGFIDALASSLDSALPLRVKVAEDGEKLAPTTVYLAPDGRQMGLEGKKCVRVTEHAPVDGFRPSATYLFASIAQEFGREALAVVLTGMGRDGIAGLQHIRESNGVALAQDEASSVVYGMPKAAAESGLVDRVLPLGEMAGEIGRLAGVLVR